MLRQLWVLQKARELLISEARFRFQQSHRNAETNPCLRVQTKSAAVFAHSAAVSRQMEGQADISRWSFTECKRPTPVFSRFRERYTTHSLSVRFTGMLRLESHAYAQRRCYLTRYNISAIRAQTRSVRPTQTESAIACGCYRSLRRTRARFTQMRNTCTWRAKRHPHCGMGG